jgi:Glyoxalase-like domain
MESVAVDHVLVGIADLEDGLRQLTALTGVTPERGGQHPGRGTQNALLSLGPKLYLELIASVAGPPPGMEKLSELQRPTPVGWAIHTTDLDATSSRLRAAGFQVSVPRDGARVRPDGRRLQWRTAELEDVPGDLTPFLIEWSSGTAHPAATSPPGCTLTSLEIRGPQVERLEKLVAELRLEVAVRAAAEPGIELALACPAGVVRLSSTQTP